MPDEAADDGTGAGPDEPFDWDVLQVVWWIVHRGAPTAAGAEAVSGEQLAAALDKINHAVRASLLPARGRLSPSYARPEAHHPPVPIPADLIDDLRRIDAWGWCCIRQDRPDFDWLHDPGPFFYDVSFQSADAKWLWKAEGLLAPRDPHRKYPARKLESWYRKRVKTWSVGSKPPSEADDVAAAKQEGFPGISRDAVRGLRRQLAPEAWRAHGRRKTRG